MALRGLSSLGPNSAHGGSLLASLRSLSSRWSPLCQYCWENSCFDAMLSSHVVSGQPGRILSSNASVTSVLFNLFC